MKSMHIPASSQGATFGGGSGPDGLSVLGAQPQKTVWKTEISPGISSSAVQLYRAQCIGSVDPNFF